MHASHDPRRDKTGRRGFRPGQTGLHIHRSRLEACNFGKKNLGFAGVYLIFFEFAGVYLMFLIQNIHFGYSLEPPQRGGSNMYPQFMFRAKIRKMSKEMLEKIFNIHDLGKFSILHGHVFVMIYSCHLPGGPRH